MTRRPSLVKSASAVLLTMGLATAAAPAARAQHVVTESEAGKLTLDALTEAPAPMVHRIVYREQRRSWTAPSHGWSERAVQTVSYRHSIRASTMSHFAISHRRRRG